jgi:zinc transport system ATP-binding protein
VDSRTREKPSLQVILDGNIVFESFGKWLYPLFDLEDHLQEHPIDMSRVELRDKVIGKAAALLILRLGVGRVHGETISELGIGVFESAGLPYSYDQRVPRIACKTEELLADVEDLEEVYQILCKRAGRC